MNGFQTCSFFRHDKVPQMFFYVIERLRKALLGHIENELAASCLNVFGCFSEKVSSQSQLPWVIQTFRYHCQMDTNILGHTIYMSVQEL